MKLKLLVAALALSSSSVFAQSSVTLGYGVQDAVPTNVQSHVTSISAKTNLISGLDGDIGMTQTAADVSNKLTVRTEAGLSSGYEVTSFAKATIRGAVGMKAVSGSEAFSYYSVEPGLNVKTPVDGLTARVAYRFRTAFDSTANADTSNTMRYQIGYALTSKDRVTVGYDTLRGDGANNQTYLQYTRNF